MKTSLRAAAIGLTLIGALTPAGAARAQEELPARVAADPARNDKSFYRVGFAVELPPYSFADENGLPTGNVPEMVKAIARVMRLEIEWVPGTADQLRQALVRGDIDLLPTLPSSVENDQTFALSLAHTSVEDGIFVRAPAEGAPPQVAIDLDGCLASQAVAVLDHDPALDYLRQLQADRARAAGPPEGRPDGEAGQGRKGPRILLEPTVADALRRLAAGNADCALVPRHTGLLLSRELPLKNVRLLPERIEQYDRLLTFAVRRDRRERLEPIEEGMQIITNDGTYVALFSKWAQYSGAESRIARRLAWLLLPIVAIALISLVWTSLLRREVSRRTADLHQAEAEKREVENRIAEAQRLESLTQLAGGVAHDFNNLLSAMLGNASLALYQTSPDSPVAERLREVQKAGRRAAELCQAMLAYSGRGRFLVEKLDLSQLVEETGGLLESSVSKKAELIRRLADDLPRIEGDPSQLRQLLMNLVVNASEALGDKPGVIEIRTGSYQGEQALEDVNGESLPVGRYAFIEVRDNGAGMDEATRKRIFEPFFTTKFMGRGLGLAASLGIVRGHRGALQVESRAGQGTTFRIFFPAADETGHGTASGGLPRMRSSGADAPPKRKSATAAERLERVESL